MYIYGNACPQVVLENKGEVEAMYALTVPNTLFGPKFQFNPSDGILQPGGLQAIEVRMYIRTYLCI